MEELDAQKRQDYWEAERVRVAEIDQRIREARGD